MRVAVEELDVLRLAADGRRVDLEIHVEDVRLAGRDVPQLERELAVPARLADR
jgi:hypothetical protein